MPSGAFGVDFGTGGTTVAAIGGKYPSVLCDTSPGDMVSGAVSRILVGKPLTKILDCRLKEGGIIGRAGDPIVLVGDASCNKRLFMPIEVDLLGFRGMIVGSNGSVP
jgi:hypothetical protein